MVCIDTSVWVAALRNPGGSNWRKLQALLDRDEAALAAPVRVELLSGASRKDRGRLRLDLSALPVLFPTVATWARIDRWIDVAGDAGERFGVADLLIAAIAADYEARLWSLDEDFGRMARLKFVEIYTSP